MGSTFYKSQKKVTEAMKKVAILQSNYIPWKGYFDMIASVDEFVFYDEVQFTKNDWRNRNKIKTPNGLNWLSIPVGSNISRRICDVEILQQNWKRKHWRSIEVSYAKAPYFKEISELIKPLYTDNQLTNLSEINTALIKAICAYLGINTQFKDSQDFDLPEGKTKKLVSLCQALNASTYISGPAAKDYLEVSLFNEVNIDVSWFDYAGYSEYPQLWGDFEHGVSILDLLFNCGPNSPQYMKYV